jgi:phosphoribosyl 1,2-cyclic phosphodiesterase
MDRSSDAVDRALVRCPACGQRLRVPRLTGRTLAVKCPRGCPEFEFDCNLGVVRPITADGRQRRSVLRVISLQSGSNGNCIYVEAGETRLLFDAGISCKQAERRLRAHGRTLADVNALLISHDHSDHTLCAGVFHRMHGLPLFITRDAYRSAAQRIGDVDAAAVNCFPGGERLRFGDVVVETFPTAHDGCGCVAFVVEAAGRRLGILTDLGHVFDGLAEAVASVDAVVLESNYDPDMLETGRYPRFLKERIKGPGGHISNVEAAHLLRDHAGERLRWACLAHLSADNNTPEVALATHRRIWGNGRPLHLAGRHSCSGLLEL